VELISNEAHSSSLGSGESHDSGLTSSSNGAGGSGASILSGGTLRRRAPKIRSTISSVGSEHLLCLSHLENLEARS